MSESIEQSVSRALTDLARLGADFSVEYRARHFVACIAGALDADGSKTLADRLMVEILGHEPQGAEQ